MDDWNENAEKKLDHFLKDIEPIVNKVEAQFLKYEDELKELKEEYKNE
jgi:hypothetical protein